MGVMCITAYVQVEVPWDGMVMVVGVLGVFSYILIVLFLNFFPSEYCFLFSCSRGIIVTGTALGSSRGGFVFKSSQGSELK